MSRLRVVPIVEGHGEQNAIRTLLERIWYELLNGEYIDVLRPIRENRSRLVSNKDDALTKAAQLAASKLRQSGDESTPKLILILVDADKDLPCVVGPDLLRTARQAQSDHDFASVVANREYETWFVGSAESLENHLELSGEQVPADPEYSRSGKAWIEQRFIGTRYSPSVDQPRMTARMDLSLCRRRCASFDKLCRKLERFTGRGGARRVPR